MDVFFVLAVIQSHSGLKLCSPFKKNTVRKSLFLSVCHCLDPKISLREMNDLYPHGGLIGYGDSYLDSVLRYSKVFRLHAFLHDAAGAVYTEKRKGPGYCYFIGVCLVKSQDFFFVSILNFLYPPYSTDSTVDQNTMSYDSDNVCQKTFLTMYFDKLRFCKFVFIYVSNFLYVYEIELKFFIVSHFCSTETLHNFAL